MTHFVLVRVRKGRASRGHRSAATATTEEKYGLSSFVAERLPVLELDNDELGGVLEVLRGVHVAVAASQ